jgi:putative superfamily III holin-X
MTVHSERESLSTLFSTLSSQIGDLVHQQATLARVEITQKIALIERRLIRVIIGATLATGGLLALLAALVLGIAAVGVPPWLSATLVGVALTAVGYGLTRQGTSDLKRDELAPRDTIETLKETTEWVKHPTRTT